MTWHHAVLALALLVSACGSTCQHPSEVTYSTSPLPAGSNGCSGTPSTYRDRVSVPDPTAVFADGTTITLPFCHPFYGNTVATCSCSAPTGGDAGTSPPTWSCPL